MVGQHHHPVARPSRSSPRTIARRSRLPAPIRCCSSTTAPKTPIDGAAFRFDRSVGYVRATNKGLELATSDVVVFLNNDIRMVDEHWLDRLVALCEPGVLVGQLRQHHLTFIDGQIEPYIDGWCLAGMRADIEGLGGLDQTFQEPAYYCDNDLCLRAQMVGMRLVDAVDRPGASEQWHVE